MRGAFDPQIVIPNREYHLVKTPFEDLERLDEYVGIVANVARAKEHVEGQWLARRAVRTQPYRFTGVRMAAGLDRVTHGQKKFSSWPISFGVGVSTFCPITAAGPLRACVVCMWCRIKHLP